MSDTLEDIARAASATAALAWQALAYALDAEEEPDLAFRCETFSRSCDINGSELGYALTMRKAKK